ncbi:MAG: short-chain-enoyl-CoA hydratase [Clostridia bacterium]|nr:short-chain-enoyl-CoA hydratase [Clostridia bacterium]
MSFENLLIEREGNIAIVYVNRPQALNALNAATVKDLGHAFAELENNDEIDVVILTGAGDKSFVAGADIAFMKDFEPLEARDFALLGQKVLNQIENNKKPVIAAINGYAFGGGCELAMACDIRIAGEKAKFSQPEVNLGLLPGFAGTQRLPRLVGKGIAKELIYTGDIIDAQEAWRIGLVNKVVPGEKLLETAKEMARKIASKAQIAVRLSKQAINEGLEMDSHKAHTHEANCFGYCFSTQDQKEGMSAFLEKRPPNFTKK